MAKSEIVFQLKVTLLGSRPPIWRRVLVPSDLTLLKFHDLLQVLMGWTDSHLHQSSSVPCRGGRVRNFRSRVWIRAKERAKGSAQRRIGSSEGSNDLRV